jgi:hypothetical protein
MFALALLRAQDKLSKNKNGPMQAIGQAIAQQ